ncbi:aminomethyl transferase family protein [uncultured Ruegeria sp.]|uniref:aminomethyl transferase family protein n=1 Tax=uncultured Ruegeria sp. TaxID=259304 RepID=UPI0026220E5E|nr:aminomethyl transferase family protein [uncultured Ruegeria sp.]
MPNSMNDKLRTYPSTLDMLRNAQVGFYQFPVPDEHVNWRVEQNGWRDTAVLFEQSYHMTDIYVDGPDKLKFLADISINNFTDFAPMKAVQMVVVSDSGHIIGDAVVFHLQNGELQIIGKPSCGNFVEYAYETGDYDITLRKDLRVLEGDWNREMYRFQIQGPNAFKILEIATGSPMPELRFFGMCEITIAGCLVTGLRHGMAQAPGLEFWGPYAERKKVLNAVMAAGKDHGLVRGGGRTYSTAGPQSGWVGSVLPAVYTGDDMNDYRDWLPDTSYEATLSIGGSLISDKIEDYYLDPWDVGYHRLIHWDHQFKGREALLARKDGPHRKKIWLQWSPEDVLKIQGSMLKDGPTYKYLEMPAAHYATVPYDQVLIDGKPVGISIYAAYTTAVGGWFSIGIINEVDVEFGQEVEIVWGEPGGGTLKPTVEPHEQTTIRAKMTKTALG